MFAAFLPSSFMKSVLHELPASGHNLFLSSLAIYLHFSHRSLNTEIMSLIGIAIVFLKEFRRQLAWRWEAVIASQSFLLQLFYIPANSRLQLCRSVQVSRMISCLSIDSAALLEKAPDCLPIYWTTCLSSMNFFEVNQGIVRRVFRPTSMSTNAMMLLLI